MWCLFKRKRHGMRSNSPGVDICHMNFGTRVVNTFWLLRVVKSAITVVVASSISFKHDFVINQNMKLPLPNINASHSVDQNRWRSVNLKATAWNKHKRDTWHCPTAKQFTAMWKDQITRPSASMSPTFVAQCNQALRESEIQSDPRKVIGS